MGMARVVKQALYARQQRGYAVIFFLFFVAAIALGVYSLYDTSWVASERIRLQNTADNTTYSAVNMLARDMNMMAITNRGMIANQVMVGQAVALTSWSNYLERTADNIEKIGRLANFIPYVGQVIHRITQIIKQVAARFSSVVDQVGEILVDTLNETNGLISGLQHGYHLATHGMIPEMYKHVLEENDPQASIEAVTAIYSLDQYLRLLRQEFYRTDAQKSGDPLGRAAQFVKLINDSRDGFTTDRSERLGEFSAGIIRGGIYQRAGTDLVPTANGNAWEWTSLDALSMNIGRYRLSRRKWRDRETPIGWGAAHALDRESGSSYNYPGNRSKQLAAHRDSRYDRQAQVSRYWRDAFQRGRRSTRGAANLAYRQDGGSNVRNIVAVQPFYDFRSSKARNSTESLTLIFSKSADNFRMRRNLADDFNDGYVGDALNVEEQGGVPGNKLYALSTAHVTFERAVDSLPGSGSAPWTIQWRRRDGLHEHGNLYNPFWEPKLTVTDAELTRLALQAFGG